MVYFLGNAKDIPYGLLIRVAKFRCVYPVEFAKVVESPWYVGIIFARVTESSLDTAILPNLLEAKNAALTHFVKGFVRERFRSNSWQWGDSIISPQWTAAQIGQFLAYLPFISSVWQRVTQLLKDNESFYWLKANVNPYETDKELELAIDHLLEYNRPRSAIRCLGKLQSGNQRLNSQQAICALKAILNTPQSENSHAMDNDAIIDIIKELQNDPNINPEDLFQIEWAFLPILERHLKVSPKFLEYRLASDPSFFCEVIRVIFKARNNQESNKEEPTKQQKDMAENAYDLLHKWKIPPGTLEDGAFDKDSFLVWFDKVKKECTASGHLEIALIMIGQVLVYAPADPDGLWIHHSVAEVLNQKDASCMRDGFFTGVYNSRGVHWATAGKEERSLAIKYRKQADEVESRGYHRLATTLRDLSSAYETDAVREAAKKPFTD